MKPYYKNCLILFMMLTTLTIGQTLQTNFPVTNGIVYSIAKSGSNIFLGGSFTYAGPNTGRGVGIDPTTGNYISGFPDVNGKVNAVVSDSAGGWYIGGDFTMVGGQARNSLAHIKADKTVGSWNPNINDGSGNASEVMTITKAGSLIYVGGLFNYVGSTNRINVAAIDSATGLANSWAPNPNSYVYSIIVTPRYTYLGGAFTTFGGATDTTTGTTYTNNARSCIAQIFTGQNILTQWIQTFGTGNISGFTDPYGHTLSNPAVYTMQLHDSLLIAGGSFIVGTNHRYICAFDTIAFTSPAYEGNSGNQADHSYSSFTFNEYFSNRTAPKTYNGPIYNIAISGDTMFVGGEFLTFAGGSTGATSYTRNHIAAGLISTNTVLSTWDPNIPISAGSSFGNAITPDNNYVSSIAVANGVVYFGGNFTTVNNTTYNRNYIAAASQSGTGTATSWNPFASSNVTTMAIQGSTLYAGGQFTSLNGYTRNNICEVNAASGNVTSWDANSNNTVSTLAVSGTTLFAGGYFSSIGGQSRSYVAGIDTASGLATNWQANASSQVNTLAVNSGKLYVGGYFTAIGGIGAGDSTRNYIAAIDTASTAGVFSWNPNADGVVQNLVTSGSTVYACGSFANIGGQARSGLAALDASTGLATTWNPGVTGGVTVLAVSGSTVYAGGAFTAIGGQSRNNLAALDATTGLATSWNPDITNTNGGVTPQIYCIAVNGTTVYAGGTLFNTVGVTTRNDLAAIDASTGNATSWDPNPDGYVYSIFPDPLSQYVYLGGGFSNILSATSSDFGVVTNPGDAALPVELTSFSAELNGTTAILNWKTSTEINSYGFEIEKSADNNNYNKIGFIKGSGSSNSPKSYSFSDKNVSSGINYYRLKQIDNNGQFRYSQVIEVSGTSLVHGFSLNQNYPNPFNPTTVINYEIPKEGLVSLKVFDITGREVSTLVNQFQDAGTHSITFNASNLSSGIYFYELKTGSYDSIKKLMLIK